MLDRDEKEALKLFADSVLITLKYWFISWFMDNLTDKFMDNYFNKIKELIKEDKWNE